MSMLAPGVSFVFHTPALFAQPSRSRRGFSQHFSFESTERSISPERLQRFAAFLGAMNHDLDALGSPSRYSDKTGT